MLSGFSYIHNALHAGIPIREAIKAVRPYVDEVVIVDAESNDGTREMLEGMDEVDRVLDGKWGTDAGETLKRLHAMNVECRGDVIVHFEGDEVFSKDCIQAVIHHIKAKTCKNLCVRRLQIEQNFQRVRWYPESVHRIFRRGTVKKQGHTTDTQIFTTFEISDVFLWDVTNCFRDNWMNRVEQQAKLWNHEPKYRMVPLHASQPFEITREEAEERLKEPHWEWPTSPFNLPEILKPLVGKTRYE